MFSLPTAVRKALVATAFVSIGIHAASAANPNSGTTTTGQTLNVQIDSPLNGAQVAVGPVAVNGRTAIGALTVNAAMQYIVDVSGSTNSPTGMDCMATAWSTRWTTSTVMASPAIRWTAKSAA